MKSTWMTALEWRTAAAADEGVFDGVYDDMTSAPQRLSYSAAVAPPTSRFPLSVCPSVCLSVCLFLRVRVCFPTTARNIRVDL